MRVNVQKLAELKISYSAFLAMPYGCAVSLGLFEEEETDIAHVPSLLLHLPSEAIGYYLNGVHHALPPLRPRYRGFITDVSPKRNRS